MEVNANCKPTVCMCVCVPVGPDVCYHSNYVENVMVNMANGSVVIFRRVCFVGVALLSEAYLCGPTKFTNLGAVCECGVFLRSHRKLLFLPCY